jgi:putative two-component system response regulator
MGRDYRNDTNALAADAACPLTPRFFEENSDGAEGVLLALALAVEQRDDVTAGHCERLAITSLALGMSMGLDQTSLVALYRGAFLHDIGKVGIPDSILLKRGKLSPEEWIVMRGHPVSGAEICSHLKSLGPVVPIIRHHHERWDGTGYPDSLRGELIPLLARVLQIADIFDALTSHRCYKPAYSPKAAVRIIEDETARGWRDPQVVSLFLRIHHDLITRIVEYDQPGDYSLSALRRNLVNLSPMMNAQAALLGCRTPVTAV